MEKIETTNIDGLHNFESKYSKNQLKERFVRDYIEGLGYIEPAILVFDSWQEVLPKRAQYRIPLVVYIYKNWNTLLLFPESREVHILDLVDELIYQTTYDYLNSFIEGGCK